MQPHVFKDYLLTLQKGMCDQCSEIEGKPFRLDEWTRQHGGGGITAVFQGGEVFDSAGVNFSHVCGDTLPPSATKQRPELAGRRFEAMGVSSVIHPVNPYVPTAHMNVRCFVAYDDDRSAVWWFGGGFDLTPFYPFEEDCIQWHHVAKALCDPFGEAVYPRYKKWADEYFYLPHRQEHRGIGGLFFDDLNEEPFGWDWDTSQAFTEEVGLGFFRAYLPIVKQRHQLSYSDREIAFQQYRRGRYVEFNLLYDRGTLFGLQSGGRTESILMSLPPNVRFEYSYVPEDGSDESKLIEYIKPRDWATIK